MATISDELTYIRYEGACDVTCVGCGRTSLCEADTVLIQWATLDIELPYCRSCNAEVEASEASEQQMYAHAVSIYGVDR